MDTRHEPKRDAVQQRDNGAHADRERHNLGWNRWELYYLAPGSPRVATATTELSSIIALGTKPDQSLVVASEFDTTLHTYRLGGPVQEFPLDCGQDSFLGLLDIRSIASSPADNTIWIGGLSGLFKIGADGCKVFNTKNHKLPTDEVQKLYPSNEGSLWIGTNLGLVHIDRDRIITLDKNNSGLPNDWIESFSTDRDTSIWVGTRGGLAHYDGAHWQVYRSDNSDLPGIVESILPVSDGTLWLGMWGNGLVHFTPSALAPKVVTLLGESKPVTESHHTLCSCIRPDVQD